MEGIRIIADKASIDLLGIDEVMKKLSLWKEKYNLRLKYEDSRWTEMERTPLGNNQYLEVLAGNKRELYGGPCVSVRVSDSGSEEVELNI